MQGRQFLLFCSLFYGAMGLVGGALAWWMDTLHYFQWPKNLFHALVFFIFVGFGSSLLSLCLLRFNAGKKMTVEFLRSLPTLNGMEILMIALLSGFGEEILFRGWLLPLVGYPISSLLFGILHFPMKKSLRIWTGFALLMGFVLGALVLLTDSIWTAACAHTLTNYLGFTIIMGLKTRKHHFIEAVEIEG